MQNFLRDATEFLPILLQGVWLTIVVTVGSLMLSTMLGLVWAMMRVSGLRALSGLSAGLINVIRGIPIIVLLFYLYFVMPDFGIRRPSSGSALPIRLIRPRISAPASRRSTRDRLRPRRPSAWGGG
jgi:His/Glu/Gln/Arg/opine family amino acid ABC transporter permease subunit